VATVPAWLEHAVERVAGAGDTTRRVRWRANGRSFDFDVPGDNVWVCIKDDLLLREYEWLGIDLDQHRDLVVDGGAHVGTFTAMAAGGAASVIAVEPGPATADLLRGNIKRNALDNVEVVEGALWPRPGPVRLRQEGATSSASLIDADESDLEVATVSLADLVADHGPIDLLKLDIEGSEFPLIAETPDEVLAQVRTLAGELHLWASDAAGEAAFVGRLRNLGYEVEVRQLPIHHVRESLARLRRYAPDLEGHLRLKLTLAGVYAATGILDPIIGLRNHLNARELRLFRAQRP
jgi:FkbM family methyltransferase